MRYLAALLVLLCVWLIAPPARATAQIPEEIVLEGKIEQLFTNPLNVYLQQDRNLDRLKPHLFKQDACTGAWRGYRGTWTIDEGELYLIALVTDPCSEQPKPLALDVLFPWTVTRVPAEWFSGTLVVPRGKMIEYVHLGYESRYERYVAIEVRQGRVVGQKEVTKRP